MEKIEEKKCKSCKKIKPFDDYYENKYSPDGRYAFCKICFDQFAKKLKAKDGSFLLQNKVCPKCRKLKPIAEFNAESDIPDAIKDRCLACQQKYNTLQTPQLVEEAPPVPLEARPTLPIEIPEEPIETPTETIETKEPAKEDEDTVPLEKLTAPLPPPTKSDELDNFDFIDYLLKQQVVLETKNFPKTICKIKPRKRKCNGCSKIEEIDQVEKNTVIPVHAWFCEQCKEEGKKRKVRKGAVVQDYWGREFKVKKIINSDLIMGVEKTKKGKWSKRQLKIFGDWHSRKS